MKALKRFQFPKINNSDSSQHENTSNKIEVTYGTSSSETTWLLEDQALSTESGVWRHVAVSRVSGTTRLYVNGDFSDVDNSVTFWIIFIYIFIGSH